MSREIIPVIIVSIIFGAPFLTGIICRLFKTIERTSRDYNESQLKSKMIDRGYSAAEIERICKMDLGKSPDMQATTWNPVAPAKPVR
ncbi:MAG: hypothetical protein R3C03_17260 [Pirellulaceae bacterium]